MVAYTESAVSTWDDEAAACQQSSDTSIANSLAPKVEKGVMQSFRQVRRRPHLITGGARHWAQRRLPLSSIAGFRCGGSSQSRHKNMKIIVSVDIQQ
ncbi:hypothetical protein ISF59_02840 [Burkholderia pseudomallei]|nr:hypothetical protein [Burkholderia pseudomallei]